MARCDEGYPCEVCGKPVEKITESDLYLRFVIGELDPELLHVTPERHIRCNPVLAQFIDSDRFTPVKVEGPFAVTELDDSFVAKRRELVTRGFQRLLEIARQRGDRDVTRYPLPEMADRYH